MADYYVNNRAQTNGDHEVHVSGCGYMPGDAKYLGDFASCWPAVTEARRTYSTANGCAYCCPACHTS
ncbi:hypothetical protein [Sphingomonas sp.]|uniref:hypothetical protein n=1 Tax=Sphingomonas sp. TaxID=28214 RepID=UPI002DD68675|nr:hypothetical protein [Sphingomonas sp.]